MTLEEEFAAQQQQDFAAPPPPVEQPEDRTPHGLLGWTLDILNRTNYASTEFFDTIAENGLGALGDAVLNSTTELFAPEKRLSYSDLIKKYNPEFSKEHPYATSILGFVGDVALDPTTYVTFGTSGAMKIAGEVGGQAVEKALTKKGIGVLAEEVGKSLKVGVGTELAKAPGVLSATSFFREGKSKIGSVLKEMGLVEDAAGYVEKLGTTTKQVEQQLAADFGSDVAAKVMKGEVGVPGLSSAGALPLNVDTTWNRFKIPTAAEHWAQAKKTADARMLEMVAQGQEDLVQKGGMKFMGQTVVSGKQFDKIGQLTGITKMKDILKSTKQFETIAKVFNRNFMLPKEFIERRILAEAALDNSGEAAKDLVKNWLKLGKDSLEKVTTHANAVDEATQAAEAAAKAEGREYLDAEAQDLAQKMYHAADLTADEKRVYMEGREILNTLAQNEKSVKLLDHEIKNYMTRKYDAVKDAPLFLFYKKNGRLGHFLGSSEDRVFRTIEEAKAAGLAPEMNFATLIAARAQSSMKAIAKKEFDNWVGTTYKGLKEAAANPVSSHGIKESKIWNRIQNDIQFMGNSSYPAGLGDGQKELLGLYDGLMRKFKGFATTYKISFGPKQAISNFLQMTMDQGIKVLKMMNPLSMRDAATVMMHDSDIFAAHTPWAKKIMEGVMTNPLNEKFTHLDLHKEMKELGVITGTNLSGEALKKDLTREMKDAEFALKWGGDKHQGVAAALRSGIRYWNLPSHIEDFGKVSIYINARKMGYSPMEARNAVMRTLFDYKHSLSQTEQQWIKRIVPFYSFSRFAIPFTARVISTHPGRVASLNDAAKALFDGWNKFESGDTLSPDERKALPGYLLEQPHVFAKMDDKLRATFRTFNNFSPLEALGMVETDGDTGDIDFRRSLEKTTLAAISPMLKVPFEFIMDKNFFTGNAISKANNFKAGRLGKIDPNWVVGAAANTLAENGGIPEAGVEDEQGITDYLKKIMHWEVDKNGYVYVNPYALHVATSAIPSLNQIIRTANPDKTPAEKAIDLFLGIGTQKVNLPQSVRMDRAKQDKEVNELKSRIRMAFIAGRPDEAELARLQLQEFLKVLAQERMSMNMENIRGPGIE